MVSEFRIARCISQTLCWRLEIITARRFIKEGKGEKSQHIEEFKGQKIEIITQISKLSRLLGMLPLDDTIQIHEPLTKN